MFFIFFPNRKFHFRSFERKNHEKEAMTAIDETL